MAAKKFILLDCTKAIRNVDLSSFILIRSKFLEQVDLYADVVESNGETLYQLVVAFSFTGKRNFADFSVDFDATTNLFDGLRFYADILRQLGIELSVPNLEDIVPLQLRHLIEVQPEVTGRP